MSTEMHRHDITDAARALPEPHMLGQKEQWGGIAQDNRRYINAAIWILRTGTPWRDLPIEYGNWNSVANQIRQNTSSFVAAVQIRCIVLWLNLLA